MLTPRPRGAAALLGPVLAAPVALAVLVASASFASPLHARQASFPAPPPPAVYHVDEAGLLGEEERAAINRIAGSLLAERQVPILIVTLPSLASRGAAGYTIERYAAELFDDWGIGSQQHNYGMLLLVSPGDREARIEFGAAYAGRHDDAAAHVMDELILPEFRADRYAEGILAGVHGLDAIARGLPLPAGRNPRYMIPVALAVMVGGTALAFSLFNSGRSGWGWAVLLALFALLMFLLRRMGSGRAAAGGGGAFRGGSSGGGGATGRW